MFATVHPSVRPTVASKKLCDRLLSLSESKLFETLRRYACDILKHFFFQN